MATITSSLTFFGSASITAIIGLSMIDQSYNTMMTTLFLAFSATSLIAAVMTGLFGAGLFNAAPQEKKHRVTTLTQIYWLDAAEIKMRTK